YTEMRQTLTGAAAGRLSNAARQVAGLLAASARQRLAQLQEVAEDPALRADVMAAASRLSQPADARLSRYLASTTQAVGVELWTGDGRPLAARGEAFGDVPVGIRRSLVEALDSGAGGGRFSALWRDGPAVAYAAVVAMKAGDGTAGFLVERRHLANQAPAVDLITGLIGADASVLVGNLDRSVWTDLAAPAQGPPAGVLPGAGLSAYTRSDGRRVLATATDVALTPWMVVVAIPEDIALASAHRLLIRATLFASVLALATGGVGWVLSRRVTKGLGQLTRAVAAVAAGADAPHVEWRGGDEVARLGHAFNTMSRRVETSRLQYEDLVHGLEARVEERTAELQATNRELEAFSYSVSHDLRAPLRAIAGFAQILDEDARGSLDAEAQQSLDVILRNARQMGLLIDDLLAFSRLGRQQVKQEPVDMQALASGVAEDVCRQELPRALTIRVGALPYTVGDHALLRQVFVNLLQNAAKFTRRQAAPVVEVGGRRDDDENVYTVRDNGVGFDMQYAGKLFGVFQRLHRVEDFEGTGVGLAIVQRVVVRHGGRVWAEGAVDAGATFHFALPRKDVPASC
ncbi:MAG: ATP-binding protein, partial [Vicinamibacterales bacterium]